MNFIAPLWFLLGAAAAVPLLLHLMRRRSGATLDFPATRYLLRAEREHSRSIRLRNLLLMLLRVLAVLLLTVAAARPVGRLLGPAGAGGHAPTALAIVLDNSLSTSVIEHGRPALEALRDDARALIAGATAADRIFVVTADGRVRAGTRESALRAIAEIPPLSGAGDLPAAVRRAAVAAAGSDGLTPAMAILTDGQRTTWEPPIDLTADVPVVLLALHTPAPENRGVAVARPRPMRWTPSGALDVAVEAPDSTPIRVLLGEPGSQPRTVARAVVPPRTPMELRVAPTDTGWLAGRVETGGDEMPGDDTRYFAVWVGAPPRVNALPGAGAFVQSALAAMRSTGGLQDGDGVRIAAADELGAWRGPVLIVPPANAARIGVANAALARAGIPWRFGGRLSSGTARAGALHFAVHEHYELTPAAVTLTDTLIGVNGRPWGVAGAAGGTRYVVIASPLVPEATDLPVRAAFVPWLSSLLTDRLAGASGTVLNGAPGETLRRPLSADERVDPDGSLVPLTGDRITAPAVPGVYLLRGAGAATGALVVNVEENESVLDRLQIDDVAARIRGPQVKAVTSRDALVRAAFAAGGARPLVAPMLVAALLVLGAEAAVTGFRARGTR